MWEWHDYWRAINFLVCFPCFMLLLYRYARNHWSWSVVTTDLWFALTTWCFTGAFASIEGIVADAPPGGRLVFILAGGLVSYKALRRRETFGETYAVSEA